MGQYTALTAAGARLITVTAPNISRAVEAFNQQLDRDGRRQEFKAWCRGGRRILDQTAEITIPHDSGAPQVFTSQKGRISVEFEYAGPLAPEQVVDRVLQALIGSDWSRKASQELFKVARKVPGFTFGVTGVAMTDPDRK
jgi:hypothetical protein